MLWTLVRRRGFRRSTCAIPSGAAEFPRQQYAPSLLMPGTQRPRAFISYATADRDSASAVRVALTELQIECFLAHHNLTISEDWRSRILDELRAAHILVPLLSSGFKRSDWAPQELGFAFSNPQTLVLPLSLDGTTPYGLISNLHGLPLPENVSRDFWVEPLVDRFPRTIIPALIARLAQAGSFRGAEQRMAPLVPVFGSFSDAEIDAFVTASVGNFEIWSGARCRSEFLPAFISLHQDRIEPEKLRALTYQIEEDEAYPG